MNDSGRLVPIPKGAYNASATYELLDMVRYSGISFIAKKSSTGRTPDVSADTEYWMRMVEPGTVQITDEEWAQIVGILT